MVNYQHVIKLPISSKANHSDKYEILETCGCSDMFGGVQVKGSRHYASPSAENEPQIK